MIVKCEQCGKDFCAAPSRKRRFCSPSCYIASITGPRLLSAERFWRRVSIGDSSECWLWTGATTKGYGVCTWGHNLKAYAHRKAYEFAFGPIPEGLLICHHCDTPLCCNPRHLFVGTQHDNMADCAHKGRNHSGSDCWQVHHPGRIPRGERHANRVLTEMVVLEMRRLYGEGVPQCKLATRFGVTRGTVWTIVHRKAWKHI